MEERYWEQFMTTGKVEDYLSYKEVSKCEDTAESKGQGSESDSSYRNGTIVRSYR